MAAICHMCTTKITKERFPGVKCGGSCENLFHISCAGISKQLVDDIKNQSANWLCADCRLFANQSILVDDEVIVESTNTIKLVDIMNLLRRMESKLSSLDTLKQHIEAIEFENTALNTKIKKLEDQIVIQNHKLHDIQANMDKPNQIKNAANIVIRGLPLNHEDHRGLIIDTICKIGVSIQADDILSIEAIHRTNKTVPTNNDSRTQSKAISHDFFIVKFKSAVLKNNILTQMTKKKSLFTNELDVILPLNHPEQRIFVMQHLTVFQAQLYRDAKNIKIKFNFKFLWCKSGQIYLRKSTDTDVYRISSFNDIFRLQNVDVPGITTGTG